VNEKKRDGVKLVVVVLVYFCRVDQQPTGLIIAVENHHPSTAATAAARMDNDDNNAATLLFDKMVDITVHYQE
jgi:hypothetical protein